MERLREVCAAQVTAWRPPEGIKDMAAFNLHHVKEIDAREQAQQQSPEVQQHRQEQALEQERQAKRGRDRSGPGMSR
jgi:hypothetical protein